MNNLISQHAPFNGILREVCDGSNFVVHKQKTDGTEYTSTKEDAMECRSDIAHQRTSLNDKIETMSNQLLMSNIVTKSEAAFLREVLNFSKVFIAEHSIVELVDNKYYYLHHGDKSRRMTRREVLSYKVFGTIPNYDPEHKMKTLYDKVCSIIE